MLPESLLPAPQRPTRPAREPQTSRPEAPARVGGSDLSRLLSFTPPKFDPTAVPDARSALAQAMAGRRSPAQDVERRLTGAGFGGEYRARALVFADDVDKAKTGLDTALRGQRMEGLGLNDPNPAPNRDRVDTLTAEQYQALGPRQQQAIDFNTQLVQAVRRDRKLQDTKYLSATEEQRAKYEDLQKQMFGSDRGSELYAPETLALLKSIGFSDDSADLDDFLSLRAAIHAKDVKALAGPEPTITDAMHPTDPAVQVDSPEQDRLNLSTMLAAKTGQLEATLAKGQQLLQSVAATTTSARNPLVTSLGGQAAPVPEAPGFGRDADTYYAQAFDLLANTKSDPKEVLARMNQDLGENFGTALDYIATRLNNAERFGLTLGSDETETYRTPEQLRKAAGLQEGGR